MREVEGRGSRHVLREGSFVHVSISDDVAFCKRASIERKGSRKEGKGGGRG